MNKVIPRILITPGEPAGIGPDVLLQNIHRQWPAELIAVCNPEILIIRAEQLNIPIEIISANFENEPILHEPGILPVLPVALSAPVVTGELNVKNAPYILDCLTQAINHCLDKKASALVTGPVHKAIINSAGIPFTGHTEFLAGQCGVDDVLMLFVVDQLKVALATTHIPLSHVSKNITAPQLSKTLALLHSGLQQRFGIKNPRIFVAGLNPHAGEEGVIGREEIDTIIPAIQELRKAGMDIQGPFSADTLFTEKYLTQCDAILGMYHDQALPVVKHLGFERAVNVTLGLPIIRTSVDHGTALDMAGTGKANPGSLASAIQLAIKLTKC